MSRKRHAKKKQRRGPMCRLALVPSKSLGLCKEFFDGLVKSNGGSGNGLAYHDKEGLKIIKGVHLGVDNIISSVDPDDIVEPYCMFHSRIPSKGGITDGNCHPFDIGEDRALCHNGTWVSSTDWARQMVIADKMTIAEFKDYSDSRIMSILVKLKGLDALELPDHGVWMVLGKKDSYVYYHSGDFEIANIGGVYWYASEFSQLYDEHYELDYDSIIKINAKGFKVIEGGYKKKTSMSRSYSYGYGNYLGSGCSDYKKYLSVLQADDDKPVSYNVVDLIEEARAEREKLEADKEYEELSGKYGSKIIIKRR